MKLATLFTAAVLLLAGTAFADEDYVQDANYAQDVQFYLSRMQYSPLPDPADAGAADGAYYADLMANKGVKRVNFTLVGAKEMRNPRWNSETADDREAAEYGLSFVFGFNDEAAIRGMMSPKGEPYTHSDATPQQLTDDMWHRSERAAAGQYDTPTPTPGPVTLTFTPLPEEMKEKIAAEQSAQAKREREIFNKQEAEREANGDFSRAPGLTPEQREAAAVKWAEADAAKRMKAATPYPQ
jgi:hypothetical protein